jgi:hypothetical protein
MVSWHRNPRRVLTDPPAFHRPQPLRANAHFKLASLPASTPPSLEPILFPKLRIYFADFPYSHSSLNYRLRTLETCCGLWYGYRSGALCADRIFTRVLLRSTYAENQHTLVHLCWPISGQAHSRPLCALRRKDNSSVGQ